MAQVASQMMFKQADFRLKFGRQAPSEFRRKLTPLNRLRIEHSEDIHWNVVKSGQAPEFTRTVDRPLRDRSRNLSEQIATLDLRLIDLGKIGPSIRGNPYEGQNVLV